MLDNYLVPDWPAPAAVKAFSTTRVGGMSRGTYQEFNLASHVGDCSKAVKKNRDLLLKQLNLPSEPFWLSQIHSTQILDLSSIKASDWSQSARRSSSKSFEADASYTQRANQVCVVMTADCLPILLCDRQAYWVAAVHAGWRGLAAGILEKTVAQYSGDTSQLIAWIGPAISAKHFEVGEEVRQAFGLSDAESLNFFESKGETHYHCDFIGLCQHILSKLNVKSYGGQWCSYSDQRFYSYRRDGETGRMASLIWIDNES